MVKRLFDVVFSLIGLVLASPVIFVLAVMVKKDGGPALYTPWRGGKNGKNFRMYKFRSMVVNADKIGGPSTSGDDPRVTGIGKIMRKYKLDELPQFLNNRFTI